VNLLMKGFVFLCDFLFSKRGVVFVDYVFVMLEYLFRIFLAGVCGAIIGYERKNRGKGAGIRTHIIVAIASALMMVVSKYGFNDLSFGEDFRLDPSRVASQIVSGVGFLGAGMIFVQKQTVKGLTTAAGIWATSGIGMAIGSGMYMLGVMTSLLILVIQILTHQKWRFLRQPVEEQIVFHITSDENSLEYLKGYIKQLGIDADSVNVKHNEDSSMTVEITAMMPHGFNALDLMEHDKKYILSISM